MPLWQSCIDARVSNGVGQWTVDLSTRLAFLSGAMSRMLQWGPHSRIVPLEQFFDTVHPDDLSRVLNQLDTLHEGLLEFSHAHILQDGTLLQLKTYATPAAKEGTPRPRRLVAISRNMTAEMQGMLELKRQVEECHMLDSYTKLYNRSYFFDEYARLQKSNMLHFCLTLMDINNLQLINSLYGNAKGNAVILEIAAVLKQSFPAGSLIARIDGGQFAVLQYNTGMQEAEAACKAVHAYCVATMQRLLPLSISWGSACRTEMATSVNAVYRRAEANLHSNKYVEKHSQYHEIVQVLLETMRSRNLETAEHIARIQAMAQRVGHKMQLPHDAAARLELLGAMHDIGKIAIPDHIINKPGKLTGEEWATMQSHPMIGYRIACTSQGLASIADEILAHHERWDGKGYPNGIAGEQIPVLSRILAIVDSYDAMTNDRVYRKALSREEALYELAANAGTQFAPDITELFIRILQT